MLLKLLRAMTTPTTPAALVPIPKNGVDYRTRVVLAPMVRSGELPSRLLALRYGADLVWGPETIDRAMIGTTRRINPRTQTIEFARSPSSGGSKAPNPPAFPKPDSIIYRIHPELERGRLVYQLGTASPALAVEAAKLVAADVAGIDVNAGCPKPFSTAGGMGAALLRTPDLLVAILDALVAEVGRVWEIGVSVKIRLLETPEETEALVRRLVKTGITGLTVHCRTTPMRPRERARREQLRMIVSVCREAGVACVMNGDVESRAAAVELMAEYGADGAMIATAAEKNPSVFRREGMLGWKEVTQEYIRCALAVENRWGNTKFLLAQHINGKDPMMERMNKSQGYVDVVKALEMEEELGEQAERVDEILGIARRLGRPEKWTHVREQEKMSGAIGGFADGIALHHEVPAGLQAPLAV